MSLYDAIFVRPWPWWAAGIGIGAVAVALAGLANRPLSVTTGFGSLCSLGSSQPYFRRGEFGPASRWRLGFLAALVAGAALSALLAGGFGSHAAAGDLATHVGLGTQAIVLALGGFCVGFGARLAGGCTSGHSILGIALGAPSSLVATALFMGVGAATVRVLYALLGVA
jgi:uncharacterized membrane protein YedE/YeeE